MYNYHTHTFRCQHATGDAGDYADSAHKIGMKRLGFSDHCPYPDGHWSSTRMDFRDLGSYVQALEQAQKDFPQLHILKGLECEYRPLWKDYYTQELRGRYGMEYLIGAVHWIDFQGEDLAYSQLKTPIQLKAYVSQMIQTMESGLFDFIAHPDAFGGGWDEWDEEAISCSRDILAAAKDLDMPLEINGYGFRKKQKTVKGKKRCLYPWEEFWALAGDFGVKVLCNSDAHRPQDVYGNIEDGKALALKYGLSIHDPFEEKFRITTGGEVHDPSFQGKNT